MAKQLTVKQLKKLEKAQKALQIAKTQWEKLDEKNNKQLDKALLKFLDEGLEIYQDTTQTQLITQTWLNNQTQQEKLDLLQEVIDSLPDVPQ